MITPNAPTAPTATRTTIETAAVGTIELEHYAGDEHFVHTDASDAECMCINLSDGHAPIEQLIAIEARRVAGLYIELACELESRNRTERQ